MIGHRDDVASARYCRGADADDLNTYNVLDVTLAPGAAAKRGCDQKLLHDVVVRVCGKASWTRSDWSVGPPATTPA